MIALEVTLNLENLKNLFLLVENKFRILEGSLSPNTLTGLKCVFWIWALILAGSLINRMLDFLKKIFRRTRKIKPAKELIKSKRNWAA
jgi:hypothetical protein